METILTDITSSRDPYILAVTPEPPLTRAAKAAINREWKARQAQIEAGRQAFLACTTPAEWKALPNARRTR